MDVPVYGGRQYSHQEYFALLEQAEVRLEYHGGRIEAMAGGTRRHNDIKTDTLAWLGTAIRNRRCEPFDSDTAIAIPGYDCYVFPDMSFVCDQEEVYEENTRLALLKNPVLIVEVLSESSEAYDRGEKFQWYHSLPSFREYVLIHSEKCSVETFYRESDDLWRIHSAYQMDLSIYLHTLDLELPMREVYRRVRFQ